MRDRCEGGDILSAEYPVAVAVQVLNGHGASAERMTIEAFRRETDRHGALHEAISRFSQGMVALMMQSTGCIALLRVQERCCR
jgi:hypothetical protein